MALIPQQANSDIAKAAADLENNLFRVLPGHEIPSYGNLIPSSLHQMLDSATFGISGSHILVMVNRIDPKDAPKMINTDVYLYGYDIPRQIIAPNGLLLNRMGAGWHHIDPQEEFSSGITFDDIGVTGASFDIKGYDLGDIPKKTVHDALMQRIRYGSI